MDWTTACPDWAHRIRAGESLIPCPPLFPEEAAAGLEVMDQLRIVDMPGGPVFGEVSRPWLRELVGSMFGAYDAQIGRQLIREFFLLISKKNTKSTSAGLLMLAILIRNWRDAGEFGILAPTVEVAQNDFKPAADAIRNDEELSDLLLVQDHTRTITHRTTKATLQVVAADAESVAGKKWIVTLVDELWLFGKRANAENMLREATGGLASRDEGFVIYLSTQSDEPPAGVFAQKLQYARDVRDGKIIDRQFLPVLYEFPPEMIEAGEHLDPANFYLTNPNLGASVSDDYLRRELEKAQRTGEDSVRGFLAKHLDVEIGLALRTSRWAGAEFWEAAARPGLTLERLLDESEVAVVGIDGGGLDDLLGMTVIGRQKETRKWLHWAHAWAHPIVMKRRKDIAPRLMDFVADGDLTIVERPGADVQEVADLVCRVRDAGLLPDEKSIGVDSAGIVDIVDELVSTERGFTLEQIVAVSQGWKLNGAIKTCERKVAGRELVHCGSRLMAWTVGNARIAQAGNALTITKQVSGSAKIDPLMATFDAVSLMALNPAAKRGLSFMFV